MSNEINFKEFLIENDVDVEEFWVRCLSFNNGFSQFKELYLRAEIANDIPESWVQNTFVFVDSVEGENYWMNIDTKWKELIFERKGLATFGFGIKELM